MNEIAPIKLCTGCSACANKCPARAITVNNDIDGFFYPSIDENFCIDCGICKEVCPVLTDNVTVNDIVKSFVAYTKDVNILNESSSGGIFMELANKILDKGGIVFGAAFDSDMDLHHIGVDNADGLKLLQGSKYVQSKIEKTLSQVEELLKDGKSVLFSGTPCQISGLKNFLGKDYNNLYTVDILCHGVPSPKLWRSYLEWQESLHKAKVNKAFFRNKHKGWKNYSMKLLFENSEMYLQEFSKDPYMKMFLSNICLRPSCYNCMYKSIEKSSDLTIGDAWGIENFLPEMDNNGTSIVICHSSKGIQLLDEIRQHLIIEECDISIALPKNSDSRKSVSEHRNRQIFVKKMNNGVAFNKLLKFINEPLNIRLKKKLLRLASKIKHKIIK